MSGKDYRKLKRIYKELIEFMNNYNTEYLLNNKNRKINVLYSSIYDYIKVTEHLLDSDLTVRLSKLPYRMVPRHVQIKDWITVNYTIDTQVDSDMIYLVYLVIKLIETVINYPIIDDVNSKYIQQYITNTHDITRALTS